MLRTARQIAVIVYGAETQKEINLWARRIRDFYHNEDLPGAKHGGAIMFDPDDAWFKPRKKIKPSSQAKQHARDFVARVKKSKLRMIAKGGSK